MEFEVESRTLARVGALVAVVLLVGVVSYRLGESRGFEQGVFWTGSGHGLTSGVMAAEALEQLQAGDPEAAMRTLDLQIDSGIASQSLYLDAHRRRPGSAVLPPDDSTVWLYEYLLEYRREHPSRVADETVHIGPAVARALAANP